MCNLEACKGISMYATSQCNAFFSFMQNSIRLCGKYYATLARVDEKACKAKLFYLREPGLH